MNNEPLHNAIVTRIIELYEQGNDPADIYDRLDGRLNLEDIIATLDDYEADDEGLWTCLRRPPTWDQLSEMF